MSSGKDLGNLIDFNSNKMLLSFTPIKKYLYKMIEVLRIDMNRYKNEIK